MRIIGITGPSGAGKGLVSEILCKEYGFHAIDADKVYHALVSSPSDCLVEIQKHFGEEVVDKNGALNRAILRELVFGKENSDKLELLNKITHKHVMRAIRTEIECLDPNIKACIVDAPLLIEAGFIPECDLTISVIAQADIRADRISKRDDISMADAIKRISSQKPDSFYLDNTDYHVTNDDDIEALTRSLREIINERRVNT